MTRLAEREMAVLIERYIARIARARAQGQLDRLLENYSAITGKRYKRTDSYLVYMFLVSSD